MARQPGHVDVDDAFASYLDPELATMSAPAPPQHDISQVPVPTAPAPSVTLNAYGLPSSNTATEQPRPSLSAQGLGEQPSALPARLETARPTRGRKTTGGGRGRGRKRAAASPADSADFAESELAVSPAAKEEALSPAIFSPQRRSGRQKSKA